MTQSGERNSRTPNRTPAGGHRSRAPRSSSRGTGAYASGTGAAKRGGSGRSASRSAGQNRVGVQNTYRSAQRTTGGSTSQRGGSAYRGGKKKKDNTGIYVGIGVIILIVVLCIAFILNLKRGAENPSETSEAETGETLREGAIRQNAVIDLSAILPDGVSVNNTAAPETGSTEAEGESEAGSETALSAAQLPVQGMLPSEIKELISSYYEWDFKIVNENADVGAVVKPTVDANETTEAATLGDAENPDSLIGEAEDETAAALTEITVTEEIAVEDVISANIDRLLSEITAADEAENEAPQTESASGEEGGSGAADAPSETAEAPVIYTLSLEGQDEVFRKAARSAADMWYKMPKGGSIGSYDKANDKFVMEGAEAGFEVDQDAVYESLSQAFSEASGSRDFHKAVSVSGRELSAAEATSADEYRTLGSYTTKTTSNAVRNKNIQLACEAINGTILKPGEEFSFNNVVGQRTEAKGYGAAAAYNSGEVVQEVGGGICQVSTTLYNAVLRSGLKTTKRQSHTFEPNYVTPGMDATVSWGGPDYRFANVPANESYSNQNSYSIGIRASYHNREVTISIYGRPVLKDGYSYELKSSKVKDIEVVRKLIEPGSDKTPTKGTKGSEWKTNLVVKKNGEVVSDKLDHSTYYAGHIEYYTDQPTTAATTAAPSTEALPAESETAPSVNETPPEPVTEHPTGPNGGPGVIISGGGSDSNNGGPGVNSGGPGVNNGADPGNSGGPGAVEEPQTQTQAPQTEAPQPEPQPEAPQTPEPQPAPEEPAGTPQGDAPAISDGPISDAPPGL